MNGGLMACTEAGPGTAPAGTVKENWVLLVTVSGIFGVASGFRPPRLTTLPPCRLKKLMTVSVENPVPITVMVEPAWLTPLIVTRAPIGTETALLCLVNCPFAPLLATRKEPGPVAGAFGPEPGGISVMAVAVRPGSPGLRKNAPTFPPGQAP